MERPRGLTDREWIATLEERCRQLTDCMMAPMTFPTEWRITPAMSRMLRTLIARAPHMATVEALCMALERPGAEDPTSVNTLSVQVSKARARLAQHAPGVEIRTVYAEGYAIDARSAALLTEAAARGPAYREAA